jgi:hypothetical protein
MRQSLWISLLTAVLIIGLIGCGGTGGSSQRSSSNTTSSANTFVIGEDAPLPAVLGFNLNVNSITLSGTSGNTATLTSQSQTVDFARLIGLRQLLAFNSVPAGTYNSITFQFSSPVITYLNLGTTPPSTATINGTWASGVSVNNGIATVTVALKNPVTLSASGLVGLHMHFDLRNSLALDSAGQVSGEVNPMINVNAVAPDDDDAQITDMRGSVVSVNTATNSFVIQRWNGRQATIVVDNSTTFNDGNSLSTLTQGMVAEVEGKIQSDGSILASAVEVVSVEHAYVAGPILYIDPNGTSITILAAEEAPAIPGVNLQTPLTLNISTVQRYSIAGIDNWLTSFAFGQNTLAVGQRIAVGGTLDSSTNPATFVPMRIRLMRQGVEGMLVANSVTITSGNAGSFQIQNNALLGYVLGAPLTVKTAQRTRFINVNGLTGLQSSGTARLEVRGLILKDQTTGQPTMYAHWVRLLP